MSLLFILKSASCRTLNTPRGAPLAHGSYPNFYGSGHPVEYCVTANQRGLKSDLESFSAVGGKATPLVLAYSHFESVPSYKLLGIFTSHKSKGRSGRVDAERGFPQF